MKMMILMMLEVVMMVKVVVVLMTFIFKLTPTYLDEVGSSFSNHNSWSMGITGSNVWHYASISDSDTSHSLNFQLMINNREWIGIRAHFAGSSLMILWIRVMFHCTLPIGVTSIFQALAIFRWSLDQLNIVPVN